MGSTAEGGKPLFMDPDPWRARDAFRDKAKGRRDKVTTVADAVDRLVSDGDYLATIWRVSGEYLASIWRLLGEYLATIWRVSGEYLATIWRVSGKYLATIWRVFGDYLATIW